MSMSDYDEFAQYVKAKEINLKNLADMTNKYNNLCTNIVDAMSIDPNGEITRYNREKIIDIYKQASIDSCPF